MAKKISPPPTAISRNVPNNLFMGKQTFKYSSTYFKTFMIISFPKKILLQKVVWKIAKKRHFWKIFTLLPKYTDFRRMWLGRNPIFPKTREGLFKGGLSGETNWCDKLENGDRWFRMITQIIHHWISRKPPPSMKGGVPPSWIREGW